MSAADDQVAVEKVLAGDVSAFEGIVRRWQQPLAAPGSDPSDHPANNGTAADEPGRTTLVSFDDEFSMRLLRFPLFPLAKGA